MSPAGSGRAARFDYLSKFSAGIIPGFSDFGRPDDRLFFPASTEQEYAWQIRSQFFLDSLLITWLVWRTGDLSVAIYNALYRTDQRRQFLSEAAIDLVDGGVMLSAFSSSLSVLTVNCLHQSYGPEQATGKVVQIVSFHVVALLVVGLLASQALRPPFIG